LVMSRSSMQGRAFRPHRGLVALRLLAEVFPHGCGFGCAAHLLALRSDRFSILSIVLLILSRFLSSRFNIVRSRDRWAMSASSPSRRPAIPALPRYVVARKTLRSIAPHLQMEQIAEALATAKVGDEEARARALGSLAPHLPPEQRSETLANALAAAKAIGDEEARARALGLLAPHLPPEQKSEALDEAFTAAYAIGDEYSRVRVLLSLAPHLPPEPKSKALAKAVASADAIDDVEFRVQALRLPAPHLPPEQMVRGARGR
jgi:hypothetical protein